MLEHLVTLWQRLVGHPLRPLKGNLVHQPVGEYKIWVHTPRIPLKASVSPQDHPQGVRLHAQVQSISRAGVRLRLGQAFEPGTLLTLDFPSSQEKPAYSVLATVIHVHAHKDEWDLDCTFANELDQEDLMAFGAQKQKALHPEDRRSWVRFPCNARATYDLATLVEHRQVPVRVQDISASGVGLKMERPIEAGSLLSLELQGPHAQTPRRMLACVVRVTGGTNGCWSVGCNFIRELNETELQDLLE